MKKTVLMSAARKARIALAVMAVFGMSFVGAQEAFAADPLPTTDLPVKTDANKNIICGDGAKGEKNPESTYDVSNAIILGNNAEVGGGAGIAIGTNAKTGKKYIAGAGSGPVAIGSWAQALEDAATAVGGSSRALGYHSTAIGYLASAEGTESIAIGRSQALEKGSMAIGHDSKAKYKNSIAIGYMSVTDAENTVSVGSVYEEFVSFSPDGTIVTKKIDNRRRITYVADGVDDHDAATVGQVKSMIAAGGSSFDGTKLNTDIQNVDVAGGYKETTENANAETKGTVAGAINSAYQAGKEYTDTQLTDKVGIIAGGTYIEAGKNVVENLGKLDTQVKANADDIIAANTKITAVDNKIGSLSADGTYIKKTKNVSENLVALDTQVKDNVGAITAVDNKIGSLSADGNYIKKDDNVSKNLVALDNQVNTNTTAIADKADKNLSNITDAGKDVIKNLAGNKAGEVLDDKLGTISSTNYVSASGKVNENISKLDTQVKANADDIIAANTKITAVDNKIGSLSADGTYIKKANNVSANLEELDKQVNANATALTTKANVDLSNINTAGENKIKDLASIKAGEVVNVKLGAINSTHYVTTGNTVNANISALDTQLNKVDNKIGTMTDGNYIGAGNTVAGNLSALDNQLKANTDAIADKADKNLSNITDAGKNVIKDLANEKAGEVVADKLGTITSNNYVSAGNTVNANISKLDEQVKANADAINTKADKDLSNITDAGKNVIKDLAGNKAGEVVDAKLGDITSNNYVNAGNTVNANISALDKQMKVNTDNIGDTNKLTTAGLGSNLSDAVVKVNDKVGDTSKLSTANLGNNLSDAVVKVDDKTKQNAKDIEKVNGRVDELGGRVDTLGGAVSKLDTKVNKVGAGAAALAALHPMEFDSDNKLSFAAGVGNYRGTNAAAIGAFYRPNEQVMFSISGNMGNGENMVNAGVSFALDRPSKTPTTKAALVKTVVAQNEQIAALNETVAEQNEKIARLEAMVEKLAAQGK